MQETTKHIIDLLKSADTDEVRKGAFEAAEQNCETAIEILVELLSSENLGIQEAAEYAIRKIRGFKAVQALCPLLRLENPGIRNSAIDILREICDDDLGCLGEMLHDTDPDIRIFVADILGTSQKHLALTLLSNALSSDIEVNVRYQAAISLGEIGNPVVAEVLYNAMHDEEWVQFSVIEALRKLKSDEYIEKLLTQLNDFSALVKAAIIDSIGEFGTIKAVPILLEQLDAASDPLRNKAIKATIQILGTSSLDILDEHHLNKFKEYLAVAINDEDEDVVHAALIGLSLIHSDESAEIVLEYGDNFELSNENDKLFDVIRCLVKMGETNTLLKALKSDKVNKRGIAVIACCEISSPSTVKALIDNFDEFDRDLQRIIMDYIKKTADISHIQFFENLLNNSDDAHILKHAMYFLGCTAKNTDSADEIYSFIFHPYPDVSFVALEACIAINSNELNQRLIDLYNNEDVKLRKMSVYALGFMPEYFDKIFIALNDENFEVRKLALEAMAQHPDVLEKSLNRISPALNDANKDVRLAFIDTIATLDEQLIEPILVTALSDDDNWVVIRTIDILANRDIKNAIPSLIDLLDNADIMLTLKAIEALGKLGGNVALKKLISLINHEESEVRQAVEEAILCIQQNQDREI